MKNLSCDRDSRPRKYPLEIIATEIGDRQTKPQLPRHLSALESPFHSKRGPLEQNNYIPRICQVKPAAGNTPNLALDILKYQLSDRASKQKHLENVHYSLQRRLQVAKAQGNEELVRILQSEFGQLEISG